MDFFQTIAKTGELDFTMRIMSKGESITVMLIPGQTSTLQPLTCTGTAEELDQGFESEILTQFETVKGLVSNIESVKSQAEEAAKPKGEKKPAPKMQERKTPKAPAKKEKAEAPDLFMDEGGQGPGNTGEGDGDQDDSGEDS